MQFDCDSRAIKGYIKKRPSNSDLETLINCINLTIDPTSYKMADQHRENFFLQSLFLIVAALIIGITSSIFLN